MSDTPNTPNDAPNPGQAGSAVQGRQDPNAVEVTGNPIKEAAAEVMRKFKVKIDGAEQEVDEAELLRGYSHQKAANKALQEGKMAKKQAEEFLHMMRDKGKLKEALIKLGHDPRKLSEEMLGEYLTEEVMDPRDRELRDAKRRLAEIDDMERQQKEQLQQKRLDELKNNLMKDYEKQFTDALGQVQVPQTKGTVAEMAKYISRASKMNYKMTALEAAQLVKEDIQTAHQKLIGDSDGEVLLKLLGENVANKIRQYDTSKIKNPEKALQTPKDQFQDKERSPRTQTGKRMSRSELRKFNRS